MALVTGSPPLAHLNIVDTRGPGVSKEANRDDSLYGSATSSETGIIMSSTKRQEVEAAMATADVILVLGGPAWGDFTQNFFPHLPRWTEAVPSIMWESFQGRTIAVIRSYHPGWVRYVSFECQQEVWTLITHNFALARRTAWWFATQTWYASAARQPLPLILRVQTVHRQLVMFSISTSQLPNRLSSCNKSALSSSYLSRPSLVSPEFSGKVGYGNLDVCKSTLIALGGILGFSSCTLED